MRMPVALNSICALLVALTSVGFLHSTESLAQSTWGSACASIFENSNPSIRPSSESKLTLEEIQQHLATLRRDFKIPPGSLKYEIVTALLEHRLIRQTDSRLVQRGLIKADHGLCGPTCLSYILTAFGNKMSDDLRNRYENAPELVHDIIRAAERRRPNGRNPRLGMSTWGLYQTAETIGNDLGLESQMNVIPRFNFARAIEEIRNSPNRVAIISIHTHDGGGHALLLLHADQRRGAAWIIDPNDNFRLRKVDMQVDNDLVRLWIPPYSRGFDTTQTAQASEIYDVIGFEQKRPPWWRTLF